MLAVVEPPWRSVKRRRFSWTESDCKLIADAWFQADVFFCTLAGLSVFALTPVELQRVHVKRPTEVCGCVSFW
jgi:hypothetical protein